eukprot:scaffold40247_cov65-Phaeocystis_antarctica.AAC.7
MLSFVWLGLVPAFASLPPSSLPLLRSGRGFGLCRLLPLPGAGLAASSLCGDCPAALPRAALSCCGSASSGAFLRLFRAVTLSTVIVTLLPLDRHVLAYTRAAQIAAWWVDCSVCRVAAPFGARLPIAATVGTLPTACSLGSSPPSAPTLLADTSHPADLSRFPAAGSIAATVRMCTPPLSGGSLSCDGLSRVTCGPCLVNTAAPDVIQCFWKVVIGPSSWLCCFDCFAFSCSPSMRCCSRALILRTTFFPLAACGSLRGVAWYASCVRHLALKISCSVTACSRRQAVVDDYLPYGPGLRALVVRVCCRLLRSHAVLQTVRTQCLVTLGPGERALTPPAWPPWCLPPLTHASPVIPACAHLTISASSSRVARRGSPLLRKGLKSACRALGGRPASRGGGSRGRRRGRGSPSRWWDAP